MKSIALFAAFACASRAAPALAGGYGLLAASATCPEAELAAEMASGLRARKLGPAPSVRTAAAVARVRAARALEHARALFTRTNFAGCISLLSITEQELGRNLGARADLRGHRVLAQTNFWLGVCQWAAGDPQRAAASFVRSAQLPGAPAPDGKLLPPRLVRHYRSAVSSPREQKSCRLDPTIGAADLLVDGKGPTLRGRALEVPAGTHYVVLRGHCRDGRCAAARSLRLEARGMRCSVQRPRAVTRSALVCVNHREADDASFAAAVADEANLAGLLVARIQGDKMALRVARRGRSRSFVRAVSSDLHRARGGSAAAVVRRSLGLLLGDVAGARQGAGNGDDRGAWYRKWWVWTLIGVAAAATVTGIAVGVATSNSRVDIVFSR